MNRKAKGTSAERELVHRFWKSGWAAVRTPASGAGSFPTPDIIAGTALRKVALECKATGEKSKYLSEADLLGLREFASRFGAEPWVAVRFDKSGWFFVALDGLQRTKSGFKVGLEEVRLMGLSFEEMIGDHS